MSDTTNENIIERGDNVFFYFRELIVNSITVQSNHFLTIKAHRILNEMEILNREIRTSKKVKSKP